MRKLRIEIYEATTELPGQAFDVKASPGSVAMTVDVPLREDLDVRDQTARLLRKAGDLIEKAGGQAYGNPRPLPAPQSVVPIGGDSGPGALDDVDGDLEEIEAIVERQEAVRA